MVLWIVSCTGHYCQIIGSRTIGRLAHEQRGSVLLLLVCFMADLLMAAVASASGASGGCRSPQPDTESSLPGRENSQMGLT